MSKSLRMNALLAALCLAWGSVHAAGLGKMTVRSALGQPLHAEIELLSVSKDELATLTPRLASAEAFRQARIDRSEVLSGLRFSVVERPSGQPIIWVTSSTPIHEPFVDLLVELSWASGRLLREYTVLLDPPSEAKPAPAVTPARVAPVAEAKPAAPARVAPPAPSAETAAEQYGPIKGGETLRAIARKVKPAEATLEQMMVALYQSNRQAFRGNNMNGLLKGQVLKVPNVEQVMLAASPSQAIAMLRTHTRDWQAAQAPEPSAAPADKAAATGRIEPAKPVEKPAAAGPSKDVLKLSKGEPDARTAQRLQAMEEELAVKNRALKEAEARVAHLERTVADLQKLIALKTQPAVAEPAPAPAAEPAPAVETPAAEPAQPASPAPAAVAAPTVPADASLVATLMQNLAYVGGGLAGILLLALLAIKARQRRKAMADSGDTSSDDGVMVASTLRPETLPPSMFSPATENTTQSPGMPAESSILTDFSRLGLGTIDTQEIDPIAEAEVYLAYGRDAQAEEILREALVKMPGRQDILQKLLDIYHARGDAANYEAIARQLKAVVAGDDDPVWTKAAATGRQIDPENPLYATGAGSAAAGFAAAGVAAAMAATPLEAEAGEKSAETEAGELPVFDLPAEPEMPPAPEIESAHEIEPASAGVADLDFEFDMQPESEPEPAPAELDLSAMADEAPGSLDFEAALAAATPAPDLDLPEIGEPEAALAEETPPAEKTPEFDLGADLDFASALDELVAAEPAPAAEAVPARDISLAELDFSGIDLDLNEPAAAETVDEIDLMSSLSEATVASESADVDDEASAEAAAKLDLARAYLEMGDKDGAAEILQEVIAEGSEQQKAEANRLLAEAG